MVAKIEKVTESGTHTGDVTVLLPDKSFIYSGGADGLIKVWDQDLKLVKEIAAHKDYVLALAVNSLDQLYSSSRDGTLQFFKNPEWKHNHPEVLLQTVLDDVTALCCVDEILYSGDDKGIVTKWYHNKVGCQYNILEEVKSISVENTNLYTARDSDAVITDIKPGVMNYSTKATIPGRAPLVLFGPLVDGHKKYLAFITRDGKGITLVKNSVPFDVAWTKEDAHELIINTICATEDTLYTAGFDGKVKKWVDLDKGPKLGAEIDTGKCINAICNGPNNTVYVGDSDGLIKRISF